MTNDSDRLIDLSERLSATCRALLELTVVVETLAEMVSASNIAAARDLLTSPEMDDVNTQMRTHLLGVRDALQHANRPRH
ncbi:MAG TPA: hypothetical protein VG435_18690 [Acidimicrobiales bacterium]|jgi:hypothetical protein|nr:hypothetical protein [Acidimicrobiales bacterium]